MKNINKLRFLLLFLGLGMTLNLTASGLYNIKTNSTYYPGSHSTIMICPKLNTYLEKEKNLISFYIKQYIKNKELSRLLKRSQHLLKYVLLQLKSRNLPKELALLPIVESSYQPLAVSNKGATGIWQISYVTGKRYGLINKDKNNYIDYRYDITESTKAALTYLEFLYKNFNNDWLLALAAYNAGEGRISHAIKKNIFTEKDINYWSLTLPKETTHYLPKLLALAIIFNEPQKYGLDFILDEI